MILLAEFYFNGGYIVERVATDFYYSKSTDSIGVKEFSGKITGRPTLKSQIGCIIWKNKSSTSLGDIEIANTDGAVSGWVDYDFRDCRCVLKLVNQNASYDTAITVQVCIIDDVQRDELKVVVKLRGNETMLQRAIQSILYDALTASGNLTMVGKPLPIVAGKVLQMEPVNTGVVTLAYQNSDSDVDTDVVYSGGSIASGPLESPDDYAVNDTGFTMLNNPSARITVDAHTPFLTFIAIASNLYLDSDWTGATPSGWTINDGPGSHSKVDDVGIRFINTLSDTYPQMDTSVSAGTWYFVCGELCDVQSGGISIDFGGSTSVEIKRQGRFFAVGKTGTSADISVRGLPDSDVTLRFIHVYTCTASVIYARDDVVLKNIAVRTGMRVSGSGGDIDFSSTSISGYSMGVAVTDSDTCENVIQQILDSMCAYTYTDNLGTIRVGRYERPSGTPIVSISKLNMTRYPKRMTDPAPGLSTRFAGAKNWSPYSENELAGITYPNRPPFMAEYRHIKAGATAATINRAYTHALSAAPIETVLTEEADIQAEADRVCAIAQDKHPVWDVEFALESADDIAAIRPNGIVLLDDELFEDSNGKIAKIVEVDGQFGNKVYRVVTWGAETP